MILDNTLVLSDSQAITADAGSTNVIDLGAPGTAYGASAALSYDVGKGTDIEVILHVTEAFNNLTSLQVQIQVDDNAAFSSAAVVAMGPVVPLASLTLGARLTWPSRLPEGVNERYLRFYYDITGTAPSTGKVLAAIVAAKQTNP
jgi:hypothetical protein